MITTSPWWWILAVGALLPWVGPWRGRDYLQNALRSLLFLSLAAALSGLHVEREDAAPSRVVILDLSESVAGDQLSPSIERARELARSQVGPVHVIAAGRAVTQDERKQLSQFTSVTELTGTLAGGSPVSDALHAAQTLIPQTGSGSVTLATDGLSTRADDARAIAALSDRGVPVHVVPLRAATTPPTPTSVDVIGDVRVGATARLQVVVSAQGASSPGQVVLRQGDRELASAPYTGGSVETVALRFEPESAGFLAGELAVVTDNGEQTIPVVLAVKRPRRLLYIGELQKNADRELGKLIGPGFAVTAVDPRDAATVQAALGDHDLLVLDDVGAESLTESFDQAVRQAVAEEGLGLVMSGGRSSFGSGGWHERTIATMLPVELVQKEEKRDPSTTLVVVIDTSGSMGGVRVQLAKEVSRLAMRRLLPHDKVGIVEFYGAKRWAAPIQPASNAIELQRALNRMDAGGGTVILPALEEAFYGLQNVDTRYKHVLVLTDGGVESGDFESLLRRMAKEGINVSTVLTGGGYHSEFLVNLSNWGKGRFYNVPNRFNLPEVLLKQPSTAKLPAYRPGLHTVRARGGSGWWGDVDASSIPQLAGYVETKPRPGGEVILETVEGEHPVVATWRYGLGRVTTIATEPVGEGSRPWKDWPDYGRALARILERSAADTRDPFRFEVQFDGGELQLHARRQRARGPSPATPLARLTNPDGGKKTALKFVPRSPDRYVASWPAPVQGAALRMETSSSATPDRWEPLVGRSPVAAERQVPPQSALRLAEMAAATGGEVLSIDAPWSGALPAAQGKRLAPLAPWLFGCSLLLFLAEVVWRRRPQA